MKDGLGSIRTGIQGQSGSEVAGYAHAWVGIGTAYHRMRKPDQALEAFERAVEADPRDGYTRRNLGGMLIGFKRIDEAVVHLRQALQLMPDDPQAIFGLATALEQIGTLDADEEGVIVSFQQIDTVAADQPIAGPSRPPGR